MHVRIEPGGRLQGTTRVPGDKSISHRWLMLAATAVGRSALMEVPPSLDVRSTAAALAALTTEARPALQSWASYDADTAEGHRSTWNVKVDGDTNGPPPVSLEVEGKGRKGLTVPDRALDCGNSGTSMRLLMGLVSSAAFMTALEGDASLSSRPMERVAMPLREMGAEIDTDRGHAPVVVHGRPLHGIVFEPTVPSAQVKSAVLLAGLDADGLTVVRESVPTRDHTERALLALGAPIEVGETVAVGRFQHEGFSAVVPGDVSSAAFLVAAAALTGSELTVAGVGLNPTRTRVFEVMERMGITVERSIRHHELGEPVGDIHVPPTAGVGPVRVEANELPLVVDEVPVLALLAAHAPSDSWFTGAGELKLKESDRLTGIAEAIRGLGGHAAVEGDDLVVAGGGLEGGRGDARGDHRMAMALVVSGLAARGAVEVDGVEHAEVSFPGFVRTLVALGATIEPVAGE
ncbi:MAG: 3-phosphoshikimate 1-carboxyvinyltransferase [Actinomycetota bacterium]|nr:3-phosphoshikimate 1-carboxyvinyltransferase [Actinomycetota bacterium]MDH5223259.1 3-phosphoshikimate 1-carboxyvinyltransferase [Actinomycetota bacterium]MDH5313086.1 3-phosphoshikimate 1-carboxyvinyltransferase [Actinomycetota bacterium]